MTTKKYSVNVENDEVVSVEVDGVQYASPEDIPDPEDRDQVQRLITRSMEEELDEIFDDEAFEAEFREMRRHSSKIPVLIMTIFLGLAATLLTIAVFSARNALRMQSIEQSTPGRVVDLVVHTSTDSSTQRIVEYTYPVVEFAVPGQPQQIVEMSEGSSPPAYSVGDQVTVLYDPSNPDNARIKSFTSTLLLWILPGITAVVGISFLIAALFVFKLRSRPDTLPV